jgi:CheY-like chemotaxis protein
MISILIVEDEWEIAETLSDVLSEHGYHTETAANGEEALASMRRRMPDLIILDLMMPVMDGETLLRVMKSDEIYRHIPVLVLSAVGGERMARLAGVPFLRKPPDLDTLLAAIRVLTP